jgi:hypothetical protein
MTSNITKSIASRIPLDMYSQLKNEADTLGMYMKDYLLKIIKDRNKKKPSKNKTIIKEEKAETQNKNQ